MKTKKTILTAPDTASALRELASKYWFTKLPLTVVDGQVHKAGKPMNVWIEAMRNGRVKAFINI